jgi:hypothetical protein
MTVPTMSRRDPLHAASGRTRPDRLEDVAFWPVTQLAELVRTRQVMPSELTEMYLARLSATTRSCSPLSR